jgi:peptide/nickel transport system permease protein
VLTSSLELLPPAIASAPLPPPLSPWRKLWRDKVARLAFVTLLALYGSAAFADFLTPYSMDFNDADLANSSPSIVHWQDESGNFCWPYVRQVERTSSMETFQQTYTELPGAKFPIRLFAKGEPYKLLGFIPGDIHLFGVAEPGRLFLAGSDVNGRDNFSRLFYGAQKSLTIGFLGLFISFPIGIIYGGISGFLGGMADNIMMRIAEAVMSIPSFYLLIGLAAILPPGMSGSQRFALITVILSFVGWASLARVIRGMVLSIRDEEFVQAARASGMPELLNIIKHVIPQTASFIIVAATLQVPSYILSESGLSFIGLGIQQPDASWGNMLKDALDNINELLYKPWLLSPGFLIFVTILCFNSLGDTLRDILDPKMQGQS